VAALPTVPARADASDPVARAGLLAQARTWLADDPDPATRAELADLLERAVGDGAEVTGAAADLADRFAGSLQFGTAGLRGELGAGPNRMNRAVVLRAAAGLVGFLVQRGARGIVVGFDARHRSADFARDTARVASAAGLRAVLLPRPLPTPVLAFAVRHLGVDAGVMVTASHNPAPDNGYKIYLGDGSQLVSPDDAVVAARIAEVGPVSSIAADDAHVEVPDIDVPDLDAPDLPAADLDAPDVERTGSGTGLLAAYTDRVAGLVGACGPGRAGLRVVHTSVHGVGGPVFAAAAVAAGFAPPLQVPEQARPDPDFPTTPFPNPEEAGVLDLALDLARRTAADLVVANDPDADRCAVAIPDPTAPGAWRRLTGDEVGVLLASRLVGEAGPLAGVDPARTVFARTIVSSTWLDSIAAAHGVEVVRTLTGFKWLARVPRLRYAYEEALGYCVDPDGVADKDGISAALLVLDLAARLAADGATLADALDDLTRAHGVHATGQLSIRVADLAERDVALQRLRDAAPTALGGLDVTGSDDLAQPTDGLPPTPGLRLWLCGDGGLRGNGGTRAWVVVRPSGTERKLKCYLEVVVPDAGDLVAARSSAGLSLAAVTDELRAVLGA